MITDEQIEDTAAKVAAAIADFRAGRVTKWTLNFQRGCIGMNGCENSIHNGGTECHLCDVIAKLPQPPSAQELASKREQKLTELQERKRTGERTKKRRRRAEFS